MPRRFVILPFAVLASCAPEKRAEPIAEAAAVPALHATEAPTPKPVQLPAAATSPAAGPRVVRSAVGGISLTAVTFDSRTHRLAVADQPGGPGSKWADAQTAGSSLGGLAAVNAGFFTPEGGPLGLVVSGGKRAGSVNRASSLGAGFYSDGGSPALLRREKWSGTASDAVQSGPFLIEKSRPVPGLSQQSSTARTIIGWDGGSRWFLARSGACSLAGLGQALDGAEIGGIKPVAVLNLDGGRSSDLWISGSVQGDQIVERPFWNKPVRNFLVLLPRH